MLGLYLPCDSEEMEGARAHQLGTLLLPVCMKQVCNQQEKAAKTLQEPSYFKGSLWGKSTCLRLSGVSSSFPTQAWRGGCQQRLKGSLSSAGSFQSESVDLPVPLEFEEAEGPAQTSTLYARACSVLTTQLKYVVKAERDTYSCQQ